jgi:preprotein translocase subunit SecD
MARNGSSLIAAMLLGVSAPAFAGDRNFLIAGEKFDEAEILDARAQPDLGGKATIMITFSAEAAKRLATLSKAHIGKPVRIELDGKALAEPLVQGEITDGIAQISGNFTVPEADALALKIAGKPPLSDGLDEP